MASPETPTQVKVNIANEATTAGSATIQASLAQPPQVQEIVRKEAVEPEQVERVVDQALAEAEKAKQPEVSADRVEQLVKEALSKQQAVQAEARQKEVPVNIVVGQPKVLPGNPAPQMNIQAIPVETSSKPKEGLPTVAAGATSSTQSDIEKQILAAADREEAAKEAVQKA